MLGCVSPWLIVGTPDKNMSPSGAAFTFETPVLKILGVLVGAVFFSY